MRGATLRQMRAFALVARHRSFVRAATELHLTPSAVSLQIKELEQAAGLPLFGRRARSVSMTAAGELLLADVERALQALQHADESLARLRQRTTGRVRVGMVSSARYFLPRMLAQFGEQHRDVELQLVVGNRDRLLDDLRRGDVDLAVMGSPPSGFECSAEAFASLPLGIVAAPEHELASERDIAPATLAAHGIICREPGSGTRAALERFIREHKLAWPLHREMRCNDAIKQAVMANLGLAFLSLHAAALEMQGGLLVAIDVIGLPLVRRWFVVDVDASARSEPARALRRFILERGANATALARDPARGGTAAALH
jgi:DNA-binding transcriptional LysR family regulator